jgi:hypothetical protein
MKKLTYLLLASLLAAACDNPMEPDPTALPLSDDLDAFTAAAVAGGDYLALQVNDPPGDQTGAIDVRKMRLVFDRQTGDYRIVLTAAKDAPFVGAFRVNVNLFNPALGTASYPSVFSHTMADFDFAEPVTRLVLAGTDARLTLWEKGHEVFTNSLDGTANPSGTSLFRSSVTNLPMGFLTNEDVIAPRDRAAPVKIHGAGNLPAEPVVVSRMVGDADGFGLGIEEGEVHNGHFDARESSDPSFTDRMPAGLDFTWWHSFALPPAAQVTDAELVLFTLGVQDGDSQVVGSDTDVRLFIDGAEVAGAFDDVDQFDWIDGQWSSFAGRVVIPIPEALLASLADGMASVRIEILQLGTAPSTDAIAIDYAMLQVVAE